MFESDMFRVLHWGLMLSGDPKEHQLKTQIGLPFRRAVQRISHGILWRCRHYVEMRIRPWWAQLYVTGRWYFKSEGRRHQLPAALVVSLTSYPPRFATLIYTLRSLLRQTIKADHVILWIAYCDLKLLPKSVTELQSDGLEIRATDDLRSYKKIIPALHAFPNAFICTADDDLYYWPTWLEELVDDLSLRERIVTCHRAHEITFDSQGEFKPYSEWNHGARSRKKSRSLFPTSGAGVLYPPGSLVHSAEDREACLELCPNADDIWLYWMARKNGASFKTTKSWHKLITWHGSQKVALWIDNVLTGGNDEQIKRMVAKFGYPGYRKYDPR